jgi:hypothetical protein
MNHIKENPSSHRITHWLERLEWQTEALLEDIVLDSLSTKDRLTLAVQYLQQMQRFLQLSQQIEVNTRSTEEQAVIESMKAWMRGEPDEVGTAVHLRPHPPPPMRGEPDEVGHAVDPVPCQPTAMLADERMRGEPDEVGHAVDPVPC